MVNKPGSGTENLLHGIIRSPMLKAVLVWIALTSCDVREAVAQVIGKSEPIAAVQKNKREEKKTPPLLSVPELRRLINDLGHEDFKNVREPAHLALMQYHDDPVLLRLLAAEAALDPKTPGFDQERKARCGSILGKAEKELMQKYHKPLNYPITPFPRVMLEKFPPGLVDGPSPVVNLDLLKKPFITTLQNALLPLDIEAPRREWCEVTEVIRQAHPQLSMDDARNRARTPEELHDILLKWSQQLERYNEYLIDGEEAERRKLNLPPLRQEKKHGAISTPIRSQSTFAPAGATADERPGGSISASEGMV